MRCGDSFAHSSIVVGMFALLLALAVPSLVRAECVAWRQTGQCDPDGPRESGSDLTCNQVVPSGVSGFCDCGNGLRARAVTCDHAPFDCFSQCRAGTSEVAESTPCESADGKCADGSITGTGRHAPQAYTCRAWRQTHGCSANGRRDAASDRGCDDDIDAGASGFCECVGADGRPMNVRLSACDHAVFKCTTECARASHYQCDGWRQTGNCSADGLREPERDLLCSTRVPAGVSGFCECGGGRRRVARPPKCSLDVDVASCDDTCRRGEGLYEVLGLAETADEEAREIKQAFRRLSLKLHPDKQRSAEQRSAATIRFAEVREAYDVLSDPDSRILYTMHGHKAASEAKTKKRSGPSTVEMELSMADVYTGAHRTMQISRRVVCKGCRKDDPSAADRARCRRCGECPNEIKPVNVQVAPGKQPPFPRKAHRPPADLFLCPCLWIGGSRAPLCPSVHSPLDLSALASASPYQVFSFLSPRAWACVRMGPSSRRSSCTPPYGRRFRHPAGGRGALRRAM